MENIDLLQKAKAVLQHNLYEVKLNGRLYRRTVPSREFYIHQWNWDSATHAMGLVYFDEQRAYDELYSLVSGQWNNGLIAQITFNPNETKYFPGSSFWGTESYSNGEITTSGITQPPLLIISFVVVYKQMKDKKLKDKMLSEILPKVIKYIHYLKKFRDPENSGLLTMVHPWESGTDNSPRWDKILSDISLDEVPDEVKITVNKYRSDDKLGDPKHRPGLTDYYKYMYLVWLYKNWNWDYVKIVEKSPFAVKDILFSSLFCWGCVELSRLMVELGNKRDGKNLSEMAGTTKEGLLKTWDPREVLFKDINVTLGKHEFILEDTIATFAPLLAMSLEDDIVKPLLSKLADSQMYWTLYPVPTTPVNSKKFEIARYWRGPTWPITNMFLIEGLGVQSKNLKARDLQKKLIVKTLDMIKENGFYEYFDPSSGVARPDKTQAALGFGSFSWTAAISLYLLNKYKL